MRHHGLIASFGTSAMLVASALAALSIVSAIVAFKGFPGPSIDRTSQPLLLVQSDTPFADDDAPAKPELVLRPPPRDALERGVSAPSSTGGSPSGGGSATGGGSSGSDVLAREPTPVAPPTSSPAPTGSPAGGSSTGSGGTTGTTPQEQLENTVEPVTDGVRELLDAPLRDVGNVLRR